MVYQTLVFASAFLGTLLVVGERILTRRHHLLHPRGALHWLRVNVFCNFRDERRSRWPFWMTLTSFFTILSYLVLAWPRLCIPSLDNKHSDTLAQGGLMEVFQVYQQPADSSPVHCEVLLMEHVFAFSYGKPFIGFYKPPSCPFHSVTMTLTVTSRGRQFDRLALMFLGDVEVFRSSTAEPTVKGITWTYKKDMTPYLSLWRQQQKLIFDLGNLVDETYTGSFNATLTATFFERPSPGQTADLILPISSQRSASDAPSAFSLPFDDATVTHTLPPGVLRAIISISACGQATEEFWYSNVLSPHTDSFLNTTGPLYGFSPFREVQLLIDGYLAGVVWPFPVIFTGGIAPGLWRPVVGIDAFDLREPEIDITPWVPWLSDGQEHQFQLRVIGLDGGGGSLNLSSTVGDYWVVTGKILVFLDEDQNITIRGDSHSLPSIFAPDPAIGAKSSMEQSANGINETLTYSISASRTLVITSEAGSWVQNLDFLNNNSLTSKGLTQATTQSTKVNFAALNFRDPRLSFSVTSSYPLSVNTTIGIFQNGSGISIDAAVSRGLAIDSTGRIDGSLFTLTAGESKLTTSQFGSARYSSQPNRSYSFGDVTQDFWEYSKQGISIVHVKAVNGSIAFEDGDIRHNDIGPCDIDLAISPLETTLPYRSLRGLVGRGP